MTTSAQGIDLIKRHEILRLQAYPDSGGYSVGYGHYGVPVGTAITEAEAEALLRQDLPARERAVKALGASLAQNQFDALVSLCYNIGTGAFAGSTVARLVRENPAPRPELERAWRAWRLADGKVSDGLERRRADEYALYSSASSSADSPLPVLALLAILTLLLSTL